MGRTCALIVVIFTLSCCAVAKDYQLTRRPQLKLVLRAEVHSEDTD